MKHLLAPVLAALALGIAASTVSAQGARGAASHHVSLSLRRLRVSFVNSGRMECAFLGGLRCNLLNIHVKK